MLEAAAKLAVVLVCLVLAGVSRAQEPTGAEEQPQLKSERPAEEPEEIVICAPRLESPASASGFVEVISTEQSGAMHSVAESVSQAVGVQVRRLGGLGSFGAASIRGSTPEQVPVYLDGVLLNAGGFETVDLGKLSLELLSRIEIARGPGAALAGGGPGGAIFLHTRRPGQRRTELELSAGSFATWSLTGLHDQPFAQSSLLLMANAQGSRGDFYYLNRNGTLFEPGDDRIQKRQNNQHLQGTGLLSFETRLGEWRLQAALEGFGRSQGVAGIESLPTEQTHLNSARQSAHLGAGRAFGSWALTLEAGQLVLFEEFRDTASAHGELGLGRQHNRALTHAASAGGTLAWEAGPASLVTCKLEGRFERFTASDLLSQEPISPKDRGLLSLALEERWRPLEKLELVPAARLGWQRSQFGGGPLPGGLGETEPVERDDVLWQASLGSQLDLGKGISIKANLAHSERQPSLGELFGDRGAAVGNPQLAPEQAWLADAGLVWEGRALGPLERLRLEAAWFGAWSSGLIVWVQNSQSTVHPENVQQARSLGGELSLRLEVWRLLGLEANYTYLHAVNLSDIPYLKGRRLPGRPEQELFARLSFEPQGERWRLKIFTDVDYAGRNFLDQANLKEDALARLLFGAGLELERPKEGLAVKVEVKNLLDTFVLHDAAGNRRPLRDFEAFPLPGRTVLATFNCKI